MTNRASTPIPRKALDADVNPGALEARMKVRAATGSVRQKGAVYARRKGILPSVLVSAALIWEHMNPHTFWSTERVA